MRRIHLALAAAALSLLAVAPAQAALPKLVATDGPGFTITLKKSGTKVTKLKAGKYSISVSDKSNLHDFHLTGPGVNRKTGVVFRGRASWSVNLLPGVYSYRSDKHKTLRGSLVVTLPF